MSRVGRIPAYLNAPVPTPRLDEPLTQGRTCPRCGRILLPCPITGGWPRHWSNPTDRITDRVWCAQGEQPMGPAR